MPRHSEDDGLPKVREEAMNEPTNDQLLAIVNDTRINVKDLQEQLSAAQDKIVELENSIDFLRNLLHAARETGPNNDNEFKGWEVMNVLQNWANDVRPIN